MKKCAIFLSLLVCVPAFVWAADQQSMLGQFRERFEHLVNNLDGQALIDHLQNLSNEINVAITALPGSDPRRMDLRDLNVNRVLPRMRHEEFLSRPDRRLSQFNLGRQLRGDGGPSGQTIMPVPTGPGPSNPRSRQPGPYTFAEHLRRRNAELNQEGRNALDQEQASDSDQE